MVPCFVKQSIDFFLYQQLIANLHVQSPSQQPVSQAVTSSGGTSGFGSQVSAQPSFGLSVPAHPAFGMTFGASSFPNTAKARDNPPSESVSSPIRPSFGAPSVVGFRKPTTTLDDAKSSVAPFVDISAETRDSTNLDKDSITGAEPNTKVPQFSLGDTTSGLPNSMSFLKYFFTNLL